MLMVYVGMCVEGVDGWERSHLNQNMHRFWTSMCTLKQTVLCNVLPCDIHLLWLRQASVNCGHEAELGWFPILGQKCAKCPCSWHYKLTNCYLKLTWGGAGQHGKRKDEKRVTHEGDAGNVLSVQTVETSVQTVQGEGSNQCVYMVLCPCSDSHIQMYIPFSLDPVEMDCSSHLASVILSLRSCMCC